MNLKKYKHTPFKKAPNRYTTPLTEFTLNDIEEFNEIYLYCKNRYREFAPTEKGAFPSDRTLFNTFRYMVLASSTRFELMLNCGLGCFRFTIGQPVEKDLNCVSGKKAVREVYALAKKLDIDLSKYAVNSIEGAKIKETIKSPHIEEYVLKGVLKYKKILGHKVHHLDLNSSYASRIVEKYNDLKPLFEEMYRKRKDNNNYYKSVLTNSIGCFQSQFCPSYEERKGGKLKPYEFANLSKIAIDGTRELIEKYVKILTKAGRHVLLTNTDGIWYEGALYHDENEGKELGQRKHDHINCNILIKSKGAYQYEDEQGNCYTVVRGRTNLDAIAPRKQRKFGDILQDLELKIYTFDRERGVVINNEKI